MSKSCHLDDISNINKILSDSLTVASGHSAESMDYYSCNINEFKKDITEGVIIVFQNEKPVKIEYCNHVKESIEKFISNNTDTQAIGVGVIHNIHNITSQEKALKMIKNYLGLIFKLD